MENKDIEQYIIDLMQVQCQVKIFHWQTKIYAKHIALDGLFDAIIANIDEFTETAMGKYGRVDFSGVSYTFDNITDSGINNLIDGYIDTAIALDDKVDPKKDSDLLNLRDELLGKLNQTKYLLTLK
jgi:hypothetical protein